MIGEKEFQEKVIEKLLEHNISPFSVIFTYSGGDEDGILSITFYISEELDEVLDLLDYKTQCDKSGYAIMRESNTLLLSGVALINLYTRI